MVERPQLAVALLAAGSSRRFGAEDKLTADFRGAMLGLHAARAIPRDRFANAWAITSRAAHPCAEEWSRLGFDAHENPRAAEGLGTSVALAASLARMAGAEALMIALADMPLVPGGHFTRLVESVRQGSAARIVVSSDGSARMPPAIFGSDHFGRLERLGGERGAREILSEGEAIGCPREWLIDIDTPEALAALQ